MSQTPGLYAGPGVYPGPGFYPKFYGIKEIWNTSKSTEKRQLNLNRGLLLEPSFDDNGSKKVDRETKEALFKFLASVNRQ